MEKVTVKAGLTVLHLYIVKEGFSFFLMNIFHSPLIRYERGGGGGGDP